jgi:hypothetical protein
LFIFKILAILLFINSSVYAENAINDIANINNTDEIVTKVVVIDNEEKDKRYVGFGGNKKTSFWFGIGGGLAINNAINGSGNTGMNSNLTNIPGGGSLIANGSASLNGKTNNTSSPLFLEFGFKANHFKYLEWYLNSEISLVAGNKTGLSADANANYDINGTQGLNPINENENENIKFNAKSGTGGLGFGLKFETGPGIVAFSDNIGPFFTRVVPFIHAYTRVFIPNLNKAIAGDMESFILANPNVILGGLVGSDIDFTYKDFSFGLRGGVLVAPNMVKLLAKTDGDSVSVGGVIGGHATYWIPKSRVGLRIGIEYEHIVHKLSYAIKGQTLSLDGYGDAKINDTTVKVDMPWQYLWFKFAILF